MKRISYGRALGAVAALAALAPPSCSRSPVDANAALPIPPPPVCPPPTGVTIATFHGDAARTGWDDAEPALSPEAVRGPRWGALWYSDRFESVAVDGQVHAPHAYASPLYADGVNLTGGALAGATLSVLFVVTSNATA